MATETWAPTLSDIARHIPRRTRDTRTAGSDILLGTFTDSTTPSADDAQGFADDAVKWVTSQLGEPPVGLPPTDDVMMAFRYAAEWRAASDIEMAYPNRDADVQLAGQLDMRAKDALNAARISIQTDTGGGEALVPEWNSPDPPRWADINFDMPSASVFIP